MESGVGVARNSILPPLVIGVTNFAHWGEILTAVHQPRCFLDDPTVEGSQEQSPYAKMKAPCSMACLRQSV